MKTYVANLQASTQTSYANNGKTTITGRAFQKTINSQSVIGPALTQFIDTQTLLGLTPSYSCFNPNTSRLFVLGLASSTPTVALFNFNTLTGAYSYAGKIILSLANAAVTAHVFRGFDVYESGVLIYPIISTTGSTVTNGGTYVGWNVTLADFTVGGTTIFAANSANQKAVYFMQDPAAFGASHVATSSWGVSVPQYSSTPATASKVWQWNGTMASPQLYSWDMSLVPTVAGTVLNTVSAQTALYANTTPNAFFTMPALNGYSNGGEAVVLQAGTGAVPASFTAWATNTAQTAASNVYFLRDFQQLFTFTCTALTGGISAGSTYTNNGFTFTILTAAGALATTFVASVVPTGAPTASGILTRTSGTGDATVTFSSVVAGVYYFNLSLSSGGVAVTPTSTNANFTMMRAFGINTSLFSLKTGVLSTGFSLGAILQNNSVGYAKPTSAPANTALNGIDCFYMLSTAGLYMGKISDLTSLGTTWASMTFAGVNITGTGIDVTTPTVAVGCYSGQNLPRVIDKFVYSTPTSTFLIKPYQNSVISTVFGGQVNTYLETLNLVTVQSGLFSINGMNMRDGWVFLCGSNVGQRGIVFLDLYSDSMFGGSSVISPVLNVPAGAVLKYVTALEQLFDSTDSMNFFIRSGPTSGDVAFSSATVGWTSISTAKDLSATAIGPYFQLMAQYQIATLTANTPAQINDFVYTVVPGNEISDNWEGSVDNTSINGASPAYTAFRMVTVYATSVPTLFFRAYDDNGNLVASANTTSNPTFFQVSTNNGTSWAALGVIPNTALTSEIRYLWSSPPGVRVTCSLREI